MIIYQNRARSLATELRAEIAGATRAAAAGRASADAAHIRRSYRAPRAAHSDNFCRP